MRPGVECPSLSPDGGHIVFKSRVHEAGRLLWRLHVLDLQSGHEAVVQESQSVDDQAEWLDADHVLYSLPRPSGGGSDIWVARADGKEPSHLFLAQAFSPSVVRP
jgi:Tol biopolymer transport system component